MHGEESEDSESNFQSGIIPKIFKNLFQQIRSNKDRTYSVSLSFLQIYNEKIFDLLNPSSALAAKNGLQNGLRLRWNKDEQFSV
jgi:kinesin family protein 11